MGLLKNFHLDRAIDELIETIKKEYPERCDEGFAKKTGSVMANQQQRQKQAQVGTPAPAAGQPQQQAGIQQQRHYPNVQEKVAPWLLKLASDKATKDQIIKILQDAMTQATA